MVLRLAALLLALMATTAAAQQPSRVEHVQFPRGATTKVIIGTLRGQETIDYLVAAVAGQILTIRLKTSSAANYFNVMPPGSDVAAFVGAASGGNFTLRVPVDGDYLVRVYLERSSFRSSASANYTLTIDLGGF